MKLICPKAALVMLAMLAIAGTICVKQQTQIGRLTESQRRLAEQHRELSTNYAALWTTIEARDAEILRLRHETLEILSLRKQLAQSRQQLAAAAAENKVSNAAENTGDFTGYVTKEQLRFAGFESPENALQSMRWACASGDYTNWLASLAPQLQEEELANPQSMEMFQRESASAARFRGMEVMATKPLGNDRMELKVRLDTESSVSVLIFPMVAIGNGWRLGDDIQSYTEAWDHPGDAQ